MKYPNRKISRPGTTRRGRMDGHDYSHPGYYFVTICTHERQQLFGAISDESMHCSPAGRMLHELIPTAESRFDCVSIDRYVIMPNHVHILVGLAVRVSDEPDAENLVNIVRWLKNASIRCYSLGVKQFDWSQYRGHLWQKGYHDHIVRNERELETLRRYIATNVESWGEDKFYDGIID